MGCDGFEENDHCVVICFHTYSYNQNSKLMFTVGPTVSHQENLRAALKFRVRAGVWLHTSGSVVRGKSQTLQTLPWKKKCFSSRHHISHKHCLLTPPNTSISHQLLTLVLPLLPSFLLLLCTITASSLPSQTKKIDGLGHKNGFVCRREQPASLAQIHACTCLWLWLKTKPLL